MQAIRISIFLITLLTAGVSWAASPIKVIAGVGGGWAVGDLGERAENGFHGRAGIGAQLIEAQSGRLDFIAGMQFHRFLSVTDECGDHDLITAGLDLRLGFQHRSGAEYYLVLGAGYCLARRNSFTLGDQQWECVSEDDVYVSPGFGALLNQGRRIKPFVEVRFVEVSGTRIRDMQFFTMTVGVEL